MKVKVFAIHDSKVNVYMAPPFFSPTSGSALRHFIDLAQDEKTSIAKHPEDYTLFEIGEYDDQNGQLTSLPTPQSRGVAIEYVESRITSIPKQIGQGAQL